MCISHVLKPDKMILSTFQPWWLRCSPLAVLSLQVYVPLSSSCTELSSNLHLFPSKCILQFSSAGWMSFPSDSQSTSTSCGPITWHSNSTDSPAFTITSLRGRTMARPGSTGAAKRWAERVQELTYKDFHFEHQCLFANTMICMVGHR